MTIRVDGAGLYDIQQSLEASSRALLEQSDAAERARATLFFGIDGDGEASLMRSGLDLARLLSDAAVMFQRQADHVSTFKTDMSEVDAGLANSIGGE